MKIEETKKLLKNRLLFRVFVTEIAIIFVIISYFLPASDGSICKTIKDLLLGVAGSALVWSFIELFDFIVNTFEAYKDQRDNFTEKRNDFCSELFVLLKDKEINCSKINTLVSSFHRTISQTPFTEPIYAISDEFIDIYNYINRLFWKLSGIQYYHDSHCDMESKESSKKKMYDTLVEISISHQEITDFLQNNNTIDEEYERLSNIEINTKPFPIPFSVVSLGSEGNLGTNINIIGTNTGKVEHKTLKISKFFDKIDSRSPSTWIVFSLIFGKIKPYE